MAVPFSENGGFLATDSFLFVPTASADFSQFYIGFFDVTSFDDANDGSFYAYRVEDVDVCRVPTVRRVLLVYRDVGVGTITVSVRGVNDNDAIVSVSSKQVLGTKAATGALLTQLVDLTLTCFRPQITISRDAGAGPISIISATMVGTVEEVTL